MSNMELKVNNSTFHITHMIMSDTGKSKYNVFDENYVHVCTIDANDEIEFASKFNDFLIENTYEVE